MNDNDYNKPFGHSGESSSSGHDSNRSNDSSHSSSSSFGGASTPTPSATEGLSVTVSSSNNYEDINQRCCCFNMRKVSRAVTQYFDRHLEKVGIRATQYTLLAALASTSARTLTEIADGLVMDRTTLTRNLKPLEKMELIVTVTPNDKRSKAYSLTEKGKDLLERATPYWKQAQESIVNSLTDERYQGVVAELTQMLKVTSSLSSSK